MEETNLTCPICNSKLRKAISINGQFICPNFKCENHKELWLDEIERNGYIINFVEKTFKLITASNNKVNLTVEKIVKTILPKHRTSQQLFIKLLLEILKKYSEVSYDLRNEDAAKCCKLIAKIDSNFRYI